jgi:hypothetical protein
MPHPNPEIIWAYGHQNLQATHPTTLMITKDTHLSTSGDCIIAIAADKTLPDLHPNFKNTLHQPNTKLTILIQADNITEEIQAYGSPNLQLTHPTDIVIRKSRFICNRTLAIQADKASNNLSRELVKKLTNPQQKIKLTLLTTTTPNKQHSP